VIDQRSELVNRPLLQLRKVLNFGAYVGDACDLTLEEIEEAERERTPIDYDTDSFITGGATYYPPHNSIIFVHGRSDDGKTVYEIDVTTGEEKKYSNVIPFNMIFARPLFDGKGNMYCFEGKSGSGGVHFGRFDLESHSFEPLPDGPRNFLRGAKHNILGDKLYAVFEGKCVYSYDLIKGEWGSSPETGPFRRKCCLMSDEENKCMYVLNKRELCRWDPETHETTILGPTPSQFKINSSREAFMVKTFSGDFFIFASFPDSDMRVYSSKINEWRNLPKWSRVTNSSSHLCFDVANRTFYYPCQPTKRWVRVVIGKEKH